MRSIALLIMIFLLTGVSSAANFSTNDIEWGTASSATLFKGDTLINGEYSVKAVEFSSPVPGMKNLQGNIVPEVAVDPSVHLEVYKNGEFLEETFISIENDAHIDPDYEYRISVTKFPKRISREWVYEYYKPWATVSFQKRGVPGLLVEIMTNKTTYVSGTDRIIYANVRIINNGEAFARDVNVDFNTGGLDLDSGDRRQLHQSFLRIDPNSMESFRVNLKVPDVTDDRSFTLSANVRAKDAKDMEYTASGSLSFTVTPQTDALILSKSARDRIYLGDNDAVNIAVTNSGIYDIYNITIQDSIDENFEPEQDFTLEWNIPVLRPGQEWKQTYFIRPLKTNIEGFDLPRATAKFTVNNKPYKIFSRQQNVIVNGPIIVLNKSVDKDVAYVNEDVTVTLTINNAGNIATKVDVKDILPEGVSLVSGKTSLGPVFLELDTPQEFSYVIRRNTEGEIQLSPAVANYTDIVSRGTRPAEMLSDSPKITFIDTSKTKPTPTAVPAANNNVTRTKSHEKKNITTPLPGAAAQSTPMTPGFESILAIMVLFLAAILRCKRS